MKRLTLMSSTALILICLALLPAATAQAGLISTQEAVATQQVQDDHAKIEAFLSQATVAEEMQSLGVDPAVARARVNALTAAEAAQLSQRIDSLPAGGALSGTDFLLILLIVIVVAILL